MRVAYVNLVFENQDLIELLVKRGEALRQFEWDEEAKINEEIDEKLQQDREGTYVQETRGWWGMCKHRVNMPKNSFQMPSAAFVSFETEEGY